MRLLLACVLLGLTGACSSSPAPTAPAASPVPVAAADLRALAVDLRAAGTLRATTRVAVTGPDGSVVQEVTTEVRTGPRASRTTSAFTGDEAGGVSGAVTTAVVVGERRFLSIRAQAAARIDQWLEVDAGTLQEQTGLPHAFLGGLPLLDLLEVPAGTTAERVGDEVEVLLPSASVLPQVPLSALGLDSSAESTGRTRVTLSLTPGGTLAGMNLDLTDAVRALTDDRVSAVRVEVRYDRVQPQGLGLPDPSLVVRPEDFDGFDGAS